MAETIRLDRLVAVRLGVDHDEAVGLIMSGRVFVGGMLEDKPGKPVSADAELVVKEKSRHYASRSGYKLEKALDVFKIDVSGLTACDIGASTGGFTDCLLQHGAAHVYAVDVAYGILAWELRGDERVTVIERTNARNLTTETLGEKCDIVTVDVSFISLKKIFPAIDRILKPQGLCICLIKPQFEAARHQVGKNGVLRNPGDLSTILLSVVDSAAENNLFFGGMAMSPIRGTNGNIEYLAKFSRSSTLTPDEIRSIIDINAKEYLNTENPL